MEINGKIFSGLSSHEVELSRQQHGANVLTPVKGVSLWRLYFEKYTDALIVILLVAGALSVGISIYEYCVLDKGAVVFFEPVGIFMAIFLATTLSFIFEYKADCEFKLLNKAGDDTEVQVVRDGRNTCIRKRDVVVGDIVVLHTGDEIPADGLLIWGTGLSVDESSLTGEPVTDKHIKAGDTANNNTASICDDKSIGAVTENEEAADVGVTAGNNTDADSEEAYKPWELLRGSKVMEGHGIMRVTAVGDSTEQGKVMEATQLSDDVQTPLDNQLSRLGKCISYGAYTAAALVVIGRIWVYFHTGGAAAGVEFWSMLLQTFMMAVTLVVVAVPEGLPMAVTLSLAYSMRRMLRSNNLVRKLHACETMGATTVICTDKTGTLTQNRMSVSDMTLCPGIDTDILCESMAANSTAELADNGDGAPSVLGNPTEGALLLWLRDRGLSYETLRTSVTVMSELPFSTERKFMATVVKRGDGRHMLYVKGAPEVVYSLCDRLPADEYARVTGALGRYQSQAMRTLGFAFKVIDDSDAVNLSALSTLDSPLSALGSPLTFMGVAAISDPVRDDVAASVAEVMAAGIDVKMVTGDTAGTAKEIARTCGLWDDSRDGDVNIISGAELSALSDAELDARVSQLRIISRARPLDKKRLVESLQRTGAVVAVTGDGTNDAPALKTAHVGLSMGSGTSVAKEASDITIIDDSFASIGRAVMWGRSLYANIQRFILFQLTVNIMACLIVGIGAFMGSSSPLTVTQMLWVNLIMDTFAAVALASLPPQPAVMRRKPRGRQDFIINRGMWTDMIVTGTIFTALLLGLLHYLDHTPLTSPLQAGSLETGAYKGMSPYELSLFFTTFVFIQFWNMFNVRAYGTGRSAFHLKDCDGFIFIAVIIIVGQILIVQFGGAFFNVTPLVWSDWLIIAAATSLTLWLGEAIRYFKKTRYTAPMSMKNARM